MSLPNTNTQSRIRKDQTVAHLEILWGHFIKIAVSHIHQQQQIIRNSSEVKICFLLFNEMLLFWRYGEESVPVVSRQGRLALHGAPGPGLFYLELSHVQLQHSIITVIRLYLRQTANSKIGLEIFNRFSVLRFSNNPIEIDSERMSPVISGEKYQIRSL